MAEGKTIRIRESDWVRLAEEQARRARRNPQDRPSFADLISEALDRLLGS